MLKTITALYLHVIDIYILKNRYLSYWLDNVATDHLHSFHFEHVSRGTYCSLNKTLHFPVTGVPVLE